MKLFYCLLYLALLGLLCFPIGRLLAKIRFRADRFPFRSFPFEREGKLYEKIGIRTWQNKVPDISRLAPGIVPRKEIPRRPDAGQIRQMINETCIAELTHVLLCLAGIVLFRIWPGIGGAVLFAADVLLGNLPFLLIQRYTRPRLLKLLRATEKRSGLYTPSVAGKTAPVRPKFSYKPYRKDDTT